MSTRSVKENTGSLNPALPPEAMSVGSSVTDIRKSWLTSAFSLIADKYRETRASPAPKRQKQNLSWPAQSRSEKAKAKSQLAGGLLHLVAGSDRASAIALRTLALES